MLPLLPRCLCIFATSLEKYRPRPCVGGKIHAGRHAIHGRAACVEQGLRIAVAIVFHAQLEHAAVLPHGQADRVFRVADGVVDRMREHADDQVFIEGPDQLWRAGRLQSDAFRGQQDLFLVHHLVDYLAHQLRLHVERVAGLAHFLVQGQQLDQVIVETLGLVQHLRHLQVGRVGLGGCFRLLGRQQRLQSAADHADPCGFMSCTVDARNRKSSGELC